MDSSRRAVEAYWRSRMVDGVTADEDKVAPVYKLEEICELLRTSHVSIVKEVSEYILKRLDHKSPIVKQKALRLVKYSVGKSGGEFRREMQRHSAVMRQLVHYKGQVDPLKGDALNKAVRDTAQEAISAIFADEDSGKPVASLESVNKRIEGFGNTNYEMPSEDKKSFLSEVVGIGSASIKQGLSSIAAAHSMRKNDNGSYKSPTLRKSLTTEVDSGGRYEGGDHLRESWSAAGIPKNGASGTWSSDARTSGSSMAGNEDTSSSHTGVKTREERLLDTIVTSGGVRLQPTRDALQVFLAEASKLDALAMSHALEAKLLSHLWQVRMKAVCVLESILRKKDDEHFSIIASYFSENKDSVVKCSDLPQVSLREKANKVLGLLDGDQTPGAVYAGESSNAKSMPVPSVQMPDLIDTSEADDYGSETSANKQVDQDIGDLISPSPLVDDLFGSGPIDSLSASTTANRNEEDPFADVSFHVSQDKQNDDIFSGLTVDDRSDYKSKAPTSTTESALFDVFGSEQIIPEKSIDKKNVHELISGLSLNGLAQENTQSGASGLAFSGSTFFDGNSRPNPLLTNGILNGILGSNVVASSTPIQYNMPQNVMLNPAFAAQPMNYGSMGAFIAQQQLLFQNFGNLSAGYGQVAGTAMPGAYSSAAVPDIFQISNNQVQSPVATLTSSKKDDTKAFDFISDHLSAARDSKRVL